MKTLHFKSKEAYRKWLAYGHMRTKTGKMVKVKKGRKNLFAATPGNVGIVVHGHKHKVKHTLY